MVYKLDNIQQYEFLPSLKPCNLIYKSHPVKLNKYEGIHKRRF